MADVTDTATRPAARADVVDESSASGLSLPQQPSARTSVVRELPQPKPSDGSSVLSYSHDNLGELFAALAAAQGEFGEIERTLSAKVRGTSKGGVPIEYSYDYAPLDEVLQAVRPHTSAHGLSIQQFPAVGNNFVMVRTLLGHKSGAWMMNDFRLPCDTSGPQPVGSGLTFARRYSLMPILGVAPAVDDDGAKAGQGQHQAEPVRPAQRRSQASSRPAAATPPAQAVPAAAPQETPITPPAGTPDGTLPGPSTTGVVLVVAEKPNGILVTLDSGFRASASAKRPELVTALKRYHQAKQRLTLVVSPSPDPKKFAPVITAVEPIEREPGEEG